MEPALTWTWTCCSKVCFSAEERKSGLMNRNEPSGTHVLNAGGGEGGVDAGLDRFCPIVIGSATSWDVGPAI